ACLAVVAMPTQTWAWHPARASTRRVDSPLYVLRIKCLGGPAPSPGVRGTGMDSASSLVYPGSRAIALLHKALERHEPTALWAGYLWVHRVEALTESAEPRPLDPLELHLLGALAIGLH